MGEHNAEHFNHGATLQPGANWVERARNLVRTKRLTILTLILVVAALVRAIPVFHPLEVIDNQSLVDDTYLSLEIAKNIGLGQGPRYKENYTSGYQPLYVLLTAPLFIDFDETQASVADLDSKVRQALALLILFDLGSLVVLGLLLSRQFGWRTPTYIGLVLWAIHPMAIKNALNGMETSISTFFFLAVIYLFLSSARLSDNINIRFLFGIVIGLAVLARIDLAVLGFWILVTELNDVRLKRWRFSQASKALLTTFIGFLVAYLPWFLWSFSYTGDWFPVSGSGVRYLSLIAMDGHKDGQPFLWSVASLFTTILYPAYKSPLLFLAAVAIAILAYRNRKNTSHWTCGFATYFQPWLLLIAFCTTLIFAYGLYIMGWWFYDRYLFCLIFIPIITIVIAAHLYLEHTDNPKTAQHLVMLTIALCLIQPRFWTLELGIHSDTHQGYRSLGIWLNDTLPKGSTVGSMQTGGLGFYGTRLNVVNLDGVVNKDALQALKSGTIEQYMAAENIEYMVGWPINTKTLARTSLLGDRINDKLTFIEQSDFITWSWSAWDLYKVKF